MFHLFSYLATPRTLRKLLGSSRSNWARSMLVEVLVIARDQPPYLLGCQVPIKSFRLSLPILIRNRTQSIGRNAVGVLITVCGKRVLTLLNSSQTGKLQRSSGKHVCSLRQLKWNSLGLVPGPSQGFRASKVRRPIHRCMACHLI